MTWAPVDVGTLHLLDAALERLEHRLVSAVAGKPVRDMAETLAEGRRARRMVQASLGGPGRWSSKVEDD